jgi:hypothetical protein
MLPPVLCLPSSRLTNIQYIWYNLYRKITASPCYQHELAANHSP